MDTFNDDQADAHEMPLAVKLLWGHEHAPAARGPQRGLTIGGIVSAAIELADSDGYGAISMAAVASRLGFTTMSLYRYVDGKDTLLTLLADRAIGPAPTTIDISRGWRVALREWALAEFDAIGAHPWWVMIPPALRAGGPNTMSWLDAGLGAVADLDVSEQVKLQLVSNLSLYVIGRSSLLHQMTATPDGPADHQQSLSAIVDPQRYAHLARALAARSFESMSGPDWEFADFTFGLDRLLDGFALHVGGNT